MSITTLASLNFPRRVPFGLLDSSGRVLIYDAIWSNTTHNWTGQSNIERYDPATGVWTSFANDLLHVQTPAAFGIDSSDRVFVAGGQVVPAGTLPSGAEVFNSATGTWSSIASMPRARDNAFHWMDSSGVLRTYIGNSDTGGSGNPDVNGDFANGWAYSGGTSGTWSILSNISNYSTFSRNQVGWRDGCIDASGNAFLCLQVSTNGYTFNRYTPATDSWVSRSASVGSSGLGFNTSGAMGIPNPTSIDRINGKIYSASAVLGSYDIATDTWTNLGTVPSAAAGYWLAYDTPTHALYSFQAGGGASTSIYKYDIARATWANTGDALSVFRFNFRVIPDGIGYYIIGGSSSTGSDSYAIAEYFLPVAWRNTPTRYRLVPPAVAQGRSYVSIIG